MTDEAKRCVETCREWYQAFANFNRGDERSVKDLLAVADLIESISAELEQVKAERDAAVKQLKEVDAEGLYCSHCKHDALCEGPIHLDCRECERESCPCHTCANNCNWQWRGVQEVNI